MELFGGRSGWQRLPGVDSIFVWTSVVAPEYSKTMLRVEGPGAVSMPEHVRDWALFRFWWA